MQQMQRGFLKKALFTVHRKRIVFRYSGGVSATNATNATWFSKKSTFYYSRECIV